MGHRPKKLAYKPLTIENWDDFAALFGSRGACGGCWCMSWRLMKAEFEAGKGEQNKRSMRKIVESGAIPGIIGYENNEPAAWCSVAPRSEFPRLTKARSLKPIDDQPVWSVSCLFITRQHQRKGLSSRILLSAVDFAKKSGAKIVEGYPYDPGQSDLPPPFVWTGLVTSFEKAGFKEVARPSKTRAIMRFTQK